jgi:hypothetical protein
MENIVSAIIALIEKLKVTNQEQLVVAVLDRLSYFGYEANINDEWLIAFCIEKVVNEIKNLCNTSDLPNGLFFRATDMVCVEFLSTMLNTGKLKLSDLEFTGAVKEIVEGDITLKFDDSTSDLQIFNAYLDKLINERISDIICYRKLKW